MEKVFISFSSKDSAAIERIVKSLEESDIA